MTDDAGGRAPEPEPGEASGRPGGRERLEAFERGAEELWRLWNDPLAVARHLVQVLEARSRPA